MIYIVSTAVTAALFVSLILLLAAKPKISKKITIGSLALAGISGLLIYGYGYMAVTDNFLLAVLKAVLAVCGSFVGSNDYGALADVPIMQTAWMQVACTFIQICALYTTASAVITTLGTEALEKLRLWLSIRRTLNVVYGVHEDALAFGNELAANKHGAVVFVADEDAASLASTVSAMGCVLLTDTHAVSADEKFLRSVGMRNNRNVTLYALSKNSTANVRYAKKLLDSLQARNVSPERSRLVVFGKEDVAVGRLQHTPSRYGYGFVSCVNEPQMAARLLTLHYPPCRTVAFDKDGKATENFEALIIGFGQVGQAVLKSLTMNAQFEGSRFRAHVFAQNAHQADGRLMWECPSLYGEYDLNFYDGDAREHKMYEWLRENAERLKYAVLCTSSPALNREIAEELTAYFQAEGCTVPIYACSHHGVEAFSDDGTVTAEHNLYSRELLCNDQLDEMAMILNHRYMADESKTPLQHWMNCDYFSRQSCRAATDFIPAMLHAVGKTETQVANGDWELTPSQLENLSKTEHLRWCAFHYCSGFSSMSDREFDERAALYRAQVAQNGKATVRIGKNMVGRTHACLVSWENLKSLSEKEAAVTEKYVDYQALDTENVLAIPQLLQQIER